MTEDLYMALKIEAGEAGETLSGFVTKLLEARISKKNLQEGKDNAHALFLMRKRKDVPTHRDIIPDRKIDHTKPPEPAVRAADDYDFVEKPRRKDLIYVAPETTLQPKDSTEKEEDFFGGVKTF